MSRDNRTKQFRDKVNEEYFNKIIEYVLKYINLSIRCGGNRSLI